MAHIYLCYSNQDKELVDLIEDDLRDRGFHIWRDTTDIGDGVWANAIQSALAAAYTLVVITSEQSMQSETVLKEIAFAQKRNLPMLLVQLELCTVPEQLERSAVEKISFVRVYQAGLTESGLEQLRNYRLSMTNLTAALDNIYPVRTYINELSHSNIDDVRENAAKQLGSLGDPTAGEALIKALGDQDSDVRYFAARSLGQLQIETAQRPLIRLLEQDDDPDVRASAAVALGCLDDPNAIGALVEQLNHPDRFVRAGVLDALGQLKATSTVNQIIHIMRNDPISDVRAAAQNALCAIGGQRAEHALARAGVRCDDHTS
ncbi:MAG: TIR domain-containing protein [Chloroflexi bacterium]|nr:MAG: TIR domain-containing protein [Chloroflexota bacterium]